VGRRLIPVRHPSTPGSSNLGVCKAVMALYPDDIVGFEHCFGIHDVLLTISCQGWRRERIDYAG